MRTGIHRSIVAGLCVILLVAPGGSAQSAGQSGQSPSPSGGGAAGGQSSAAPSGGLSGGAAPIETTLFAYRALQSNAEAIAAKVIDSGINDRLVIGNQADVSAFLQWRTLIGQADIMRGQLDAMHAELTLLNGSYTRATPLASLSISKTHKGRFAKGGTGAYTIVVSNSPAASVTSGPVSVSDSPSEGLTIASMSGNGWTCNPPSAGPPANVCTRRDPLGPGAVYDPITVTVNVASGAPDSATNTATVSGGGSATASAADPTDLTAPRTAPHTGGPSGTNFFAAPLTASDASGGASGATGAGSGSTPPASPFATALSAIPTLTSLAQFLATSFAVNQTLSPWQGSMTDLPLVNAVAGLLRRHGRTVFVPATYPPLTMADTDLGNTYIGQRLTAIRDRRIALSHDLELANALLLDANFVIQNPTKYAVRDLNDALEYAGKAQSLLPSAQNLGAGVDSLIAGLFGAPAPAAGGASPTGTGGSPSAGASGPAGPSSQASGTGPAAGPTSSQSSVTLPQILASDFLAQRIFEYRAGVAMNDIDKVNFLTLHSLESGGSELVKTNIFYGTHIFFSGGSVATFSLYRLQGELRCAGTALNYIGNVREKTVEARLAQDDIGHQSKITGFYCSDRAESAQVSEGMTRSQVESALGKPDLTGQKGKLYFYKARNLVVEFDRGVVRRIRTPEVRQPSESSQ